MAAAGMAEPPVDALLCCCVCDSKLTEPLLLACFHSCCRKCADGIRSSSRGSGGSGSSKDHEGGDASHVVCPKCSTSTGSRDLGLNAFVGAMLQQQPLTAAAQISAVQLPPVPAQPPPCGSCPSSDGKALPPAERYCATCDKLLCSGCVRWHRKFHKQHTTEPLSASAVAAGSTTGQGVAAHTDIATRLLPPCCLEPSDSTCSTFCSACSRLKCSACSEACRHAGHPLSTVDATQAAIGGEESELIARAKGDIRSALSALASWRSGAAAACDGQSPRQPEVAGADGHDGGSLWLSHQSDLERLLQNRQAAFDVVDRMYESAKKSLMDAYERRSKAAQVEAAAAAAITAATTGATAVDRAALSRRAAQVEAYAERLLSEGAATAILDQSARLTRCVNSLLSSWAETDERRCSVPVADAAPLPSLVRMPPGEEAERAASFLIGFSSHFVEAPLHPQIGRADDWPSRNDSEHSEDDSQPEQVAGNRLGYSEQLAYEPSRREPNASAGVSAAAAAAEAGRPSDDGSDSGLQSADSSTADMPPNPPAAEFTVEPSPAVDGETRLAAAAMAPASDIRVEAEEQEKETKEEGAETKEEEDEEKVDDDDRAEQQRLFACCVCDALLSQPVLLEGCLHNCCSKCLDSITSSPSPEAADGTDGSKRLRCPKCELSSEVARGGAFQPHNAYVASRVLSARALAGATACDQCPSNAGNAATHLCHECNQFLCAACLRWHDKFNARHSSTTLSAFTVAAAAEGQDGGGGPRVAQVCGQHHSAYSLYCSHCDELKCMACSKPCMEASHDLIVIGQSRASELSAAAAARVSESLRSIDERAKLVSAAIAAAAPAPSHAGPQPSVATSQRLRRIDAALNADLEALRANRVSAMESVAKVHLRSEEAVRLAYAEFARSTAAAGAAAMRQPVTAQQRQQLRLLLRRLRQASTYCHSVLADGGEVGVLGQHKAMTHCLSLLRGDVDTLLPRSLLPSQAAATQPPPVALQEPCLVGRQLSEEELERLLQQWIGVLQQQQQETPGVAAAVTAVPDMTGQRLCKPDQVLPTQVQRAGGEAPSAPSHSRLLLRDRDSAAAAPAARGLLGDSAATTPTTALGPDLALAPPSSVPAANEDGSSALPVLSAAAAEPRGSDTAGSDAAREAESDAATVLCCCVCSQAPLKPHLLGCLHSCCSNCLPGVTAVGVSGEACITCPKCGVSCPASGATANRLATDYMFLQRIATKQPLMCEVCMPAGQSNVHAAAATHVCHDCDNQPMCDKCHRKHSRFAKQHSVQTVNSLQAISHGGGISAATNSSAGTVPSPWTTPARLPECKPHGSKCDVYCCKCEQLKCAKCIQPCVATGHEKVLLDGSASEHAQTVCARLGAELAEVDGKLTSLSKLTDLERELGAALDTDLLAVSRSADAVRTATDEAHDEAHRAALRAYESLKQRAPELAAAAGRLRPRLRQAAGYCRLLMASGDTVGVLEQQPAVGACLAALRTEADAMPAAAAVLTALRSGIIERRNIDRRLIGQWIGVPCTTADGLLNPERRVQQPQQKQPQQKPSEQKPPDRAAIAGGTAVGAPAASGDSRPSATAGSVQKPTTAKTPADVTATPGTAPHPNVANHGELKPASDVKSSNGDDSEAEGLSGDYSETSGLIRDDSEVEGSSEEQANSDDGEDDSFWHNNIVTGNSSTLQGLQFGVASGSFDIGEDVCVVAVLPVSAGCRIVVAGPQSGMAEYDVESGGQLSFWRPPQMADGADDRIVTMHVIGNADEEDGGSNDLLAVGLVDSMSVVVLQRIRLDDGELWLEEQRLALRTAPWHLSARGSLLAIAGAQETQQPGGSVSWSSGPYLDLMHRRSGAEVFSIQADYDVQSLTLTGSAVVTLSNNKVTASDGSQAYVVEARSYAGEKLWRNDSGKACDICVCPIGDILCVVDHDNHCIRALSGSDGSYVGDVIGGRDHDMRSPTSVCFALTGQRVVVAVLSANHNVRLYYTTATSQP